MDIVNESNISDQTPEQSKSAKEAIPEPRITRTKSKKSKTKKNDKKVASSETTSESAKVDSPELQNSDDNSHLSKSTEDNSTEELASNASIIEKDKYCLKDLEVKLRPIRSSRLLSTSSTKSSKSTSCPSNKQNGTTSETDVTSLCSPDIQSALKECNVSLRKDEVERYIALNNSTSNSFSQDDLSDDDFQQMSVKHKNKLKKVNESSTVVKKRKREDSPIDHSVRSKSSRSSEKNLNSSSQPLKSKKVLRSDSPPSFPKNNNNVKKSNQLMLVNGNRSSKLQKRNSPQKSEKVESRPSLRRNQRNQANEVKINLRKR